MFWTKGFIPTLKETPQEAESASHKLLLRAGFIRPLMAGAYSYLPLGVRVLNNIQRIVHEEMRKVCASEVLLPALQPLELWQRSGRDKDIGEVMFRFADRRGRKLCLGPTHEEVVTDLARRHISSYKQLPLILYQMQTKFRDEIRPRFGLIRACEFIMKDAYSFDQDEAGLDKNYKAMYEAYKKIFKRCGLEFLITEADSGVMGGSVSHEFMVPAKDGEDLVLSCPKCRFAKVFEEGGNEECGRCGSRLDKMSAIEVGHVFKLGTKYSASLGANFLDSKGKLHPLVMGCYGIGISRLISAIVEQSNDKDGIIWPNETAPYKVIILVLDASDKQVVKEAVSFYDSLQKSGIEALLDDRDERSGVKFKDADLLGVPLQIVVGARSLKEKTVELKIRSNNRRFVEQPGRILERVNGFLGG